jgi:hypothetical protein
VGRQCDLSRLLRGGAGELNYANGASASASGPSTVGSCCSAGRYTIAKSRPTAPSAAAVSAAAPTFPSGPRRMWLDSVICFGSRPTSAQWVVQDVPLVSELVRRAPAEVPVLGVSSRGAQGARL